MNHEPLGASANGNQPLLIWLLTATAASAATAAEPAPVARQRPVVPHWTAARCQTPNVQVSLCRDGLCGRPATPVAALRTRETICGRLLIEIMENRVDPPPPQVLLTGLSIAFT